MDLHREEQYSSRHIGHLGLVADKIDSLDLINLIDQRLPISEAHGAKVTHGERVAAMIMNGLGFIDSRLYLFPEFLSDKAVDRLFERDLKSAWFNDDALGRCLDEISAYGTTKLFSELSLSIGKKRGLLGKSMHLDTTTLSLYGEYPQEDSLGPSGNSLEDGTSKESAAPKLPPYPERGYAKSGRHDLKQMVLLLSTSGAANFPVWMEAHSGNASDQKTLPAAAVKMQALCKNLSEAGDFIYVGDSAFYANILEHSEALTWITRVPERIAEARELVRSPEEQLSWTDLGNGYQYYETSSAYKGVEQRWVLVFSEAAYQRENKTLDKNIKKQAETQKKAWWHLGNQIFTCQADAEAAIKQQKKKLKYHQVDEKIVEVKRHQSRGRPKAGKEAEVVGYQITITLSEDKEKIDEARRSKGRFVLATNEMNADTLPAPEVLNEYKAQIGTEAGFKFIKDNTFQVDSVFLETPARIDALMMVMVLCLMVYGVSEYELHGSLKSAQDTLPNQTRKPTERPSLRWIYFLFRVVNELNISVGDEDRRMVINVDGLLKKIVRYFGPRARVIYFNSS